MNCDEYHKGGESENEDQEKRCFCPEERCIDMIVDEFWW